MSRLSEPPERFDSPRVIIRGREACSVFDRGAVVTIRRAPFDGRQLAEMAHAFDAVAAEQPRGIVALICLRLERQFPVAEHHFSDLEELVRAARSVDRVVVAHAIVLEFGGIRAAAMRIATGAVFRLARPRAEFEFFERVTEAAAWLDPFARRVGAPTGIAPYVRAYRSAERALADADYGAPAGVL